MLLVSVQSYYATEISIWARKSLSLWLFVVFQIYSCLARPLWRIRGIEDMIVQLILVVLPVYDHDLISGCWSVNSISAIMPSTSWSTAAPTSIPFYPTRPIAPDVVDANRIFILPDPLIKPSPSCVPQIPPKCSYFVDDSAALNKMVHQTHELAMASHSRSS